MVYVAKGGPVEGAHKEALELKIAELLDEVRTVQGVMELLENTAPDVREILLVAARALVDTLHDSAWELSRLPIPS